ncbi:MAG: metallophosphoesterase, partial [Gammaproteobacteria bacterium]|nr:metallophosphoesterase [Gammaproteobacteria bacterium]
VLSLTAVLGLAGSVNAMMPVVKKVPLVSPRLSRPLRIVQITDVHIGSRKPAFLQEVVFRINQQAPDFVCITGDLIDATNVSEDELRALEDLEMPVYFCIGNHEKYEDLDRIIERLQNLGVQVLRNRAVHDDTGVQVIGIDDMDDALQVERQLSHIEVCREDFVVLLYHRPRGLEAAAAAGVDLMLSGHTHNGQIFPFNLIVNQVFDKIEGLYQEGQTFLYVSQGTGTWGPVMRLGTRAEITLFEVSPA